MNRIRIHAKLSRLRPIPVKRALAQTEQPAYDIVDERHTLPWFAIAVGVLGAVVFVELVVALVVTA